MSLTMASAITIGTVSGIWMIIAHLLGLSGISFLMVAPWPAFIGMPLYFASGGGKTGLVKTMAANSAGALMSIVMVLMASALTFLGAPFDIAIGVGVGSFIVVSYSRWSPLSYIPGGFAGCASAFGFGVGTDISKLIAVIIALFSGAILGYIADVWAQNMAKKTSKSN